MLHVLFALLVTATPEPPGFVRFCHGFNALTQAQYESYLAKPQRTPPPSLGFPVPIPVDSIMKNVQAQRPGATVHLLARDLELMGRIPGVSDSDWKTAVVEVDAPGKPSELDKVVFDKSNKFLSVAPTTWDTLKQGYSFARIFAAYILLNDLLGGDEVVPRVGCVRAARAQFSALPGILPEIESAYETVPAADEAAQNAVLAAYRRFAAAVKPGDTFDAAMVKRLGNSPAITFVYRDRPATPASVGEIDVVRLRNGDARTYATLTWDQSGNVQSFDGVLCQVGDNPCSANFGWP